MQNTPLRKRPFDRVRRSRTSVAVLATMAMLLSWFGTAGAVADEDTEAGPVLGTATLLSIDDAGAPVGGTTFELTDPASGEVRTVADGGDDDGDPADGAVLVRDLPAGSYVASLAVAPEGFSAPETPQTVVVTGTQADDMLETSFVTLPLPNAPPAGEEDGETQDEAVVEQDPAEEDAGAEDPAGEEPAEEEAAVEEPAAEDAAEDAGERAESDEESAETAEPGFSVQAIPPGNPGNNQAKLIVRKGGDRVGDSTTVTGLTGATFQFYRVNSSTALTGGTLVGTCTTEAADNGQCGVIVDLPNNSNYFYVAETSTPAGWTAPGTWGSSSDYVRYNTGNITSGGPVASRTVTLPTAHQYNDNRTFPDLRDNPPIVEKCGLDIALIFDLSYSVSGNSTYFPQYKAAGKGFVSALEGTPSQIALYTFASDAPAGGAANTTMPLTSVASSAGANALRSKIDGYTAPSSPRYYTNWDLGLAQIPLDTYDAVIFLTDGDPTVARTQVSGGSNSSLFHVEEAVHSANRVKADTHLIVVGIGGSVNTDAGKKRLSMVSSDYHTAGFEEVGALLREIALEPCLGSLTVVKQIRGLDGQLTPGVDWTFSTPTDEVTPAEGQTDGNGALNFQVEGYSDTVASRAVEVTETQQSGYLLEQQSGRNASCTNTATGQPVTPTNAGDLGFTVSVPRDGAISCTVINAEQVGDPTISKTATPAYAVDHEWDIDKQVSDDDRVTYPEGGDVPELAYTLEVTPVQRVESGWEVTGEITVDNPNAVSIQGQLVDAVDNGGTCTLDDGGASVTVEPGVNTFPYTCTYDSAPAQSAGQNTATLTWDAAAYPGTTGEITAVESFDFATVEPDPNVHETITVVDDMADDSPWTITWPDDGETVTELTYSVPATGTPGECTTIDNTATIVETGQPSSTTTEVCVGQDLSVTKNVVVSLERTYLWTILKEAAATVVTVDPETGEATFEYTVTATPAGYDDSNWQMRGEITIENPNDWQDIDATVTDAVSIPGAVCLVNEGDNTVTVGADDSVTLPYTCTITDMDEADYDGTNTATVTWDAEAASTPTGEDVGTAEFTEEDWGITPVNETVEVWDDMTDPDNPVLLGEATWNEDGTPFTETYTVTKDGVPGDCVSFTNVAWIEETGQQATEEVTACSDMALTVVKDADATFDRTYEWTIEKSAEETELVVDPVTGLATAVYRVVVDSDGFEDGSYELSGTIEVTNDLGFGDPVVVDVTDVPDVGAGVTCTVTDGEGVEVPAGESVTLDYVCDIPEGTVPTDGTNTATVTWDGGSATGSADVEFVLDEEFDDVVTVVDDQTTPGEEVELGTVNVHEDELPTTFEYSLDLEGTLGECVTYDNTATIVETEQPADASVQVCSEIALTVVKDADATFDRTYEWEIEKSVDETDVVVDPETGEATFGYTVEAVQAGYDDSGYELSGTIEVTNPHEFGAVVVDVTDVPDVGEGVTCTVTDGEGVEVPAGETVTLDYVCDIPEGTVPTDGTNTATVTWDGGSATGSSDVVFEIDTETDKTVPVVDDQTDPANPVELGTVTWDVDLPHVFTYELTHQGVPGECVDFTNTAWVEVEAGDNPTDSETVTLCQYEDLTVAKTVDASFARNYDWTLHKSADETRLVVDPETGEATFEYTVVADAAGYRDSGWAMSGTITVGNPNVFSALTVDVVDDSGIEGVECVVDGGTGAVVPADGSLPLTYSCTIEELGEDDYEGVNTATVTWDNGEDAGEVSATAPIEFVEDEDAAVDRTVEVWDDKTDPENPVLLGEATWGVDTLKEFTYELTHEGVPGQCVDFTNTAWLVDDQETGDDQTVTVCVEQPLTVEKTAEGSYDRTYFWGIAKIADRTEVIVDEATGEATFGYTVTATADGYDDSGHELGGTITVGNPNAFGEPYVVDVTDVVDIDGISCTVTDGEGVEVPVGGTVTLDYTCTFDEDGPQFYEGVNTATVTWDGGSAQGQAAVVLELDEQTDYTVEVWDDQTDPEADPVLLGEATWGVDTPKEFTYLLTHEGVPGECVDFTNTAWVDLTEGEDPEADETVTVCVLADLAVDKEVEATFDRTYEWAVEKSVDETDVVVDPETGEATFGYTVEAIQVGYADSGHSLGGTITVTNPNDFAPVVVDVTDVPDVGEGVTCTVTDGEGVEVPAGESVTLDYTCVVPEDVDYEGSNTAVVAWELDGEPFGAEVTVPVVFEVDTETDKTVPVVDDQTDPENPVELGTVTWDVDLPHVFTYELTHEGVPGECVDFTNTAWVDVTPGDGDGATQPDVIDDGDPRDSETVTVCVLEDLEVEKTADAAYDREYSWLIDKTSSVDSVEVEAGAAVDLDYQVTATPAGFVDSGHELSGTITVTNPNDFGTVVADVTDVPAVGDGVTCTVADGEGLQIAGGETVTLDYSCSLPDDFEPAEESSNTAVVTWEAEDGALDGTSESTVWVDFQLDEEVNKTVTVEDDLFGGVLGEATWNEEGTPTVFDYTITVDAPETGCATVDNTATIVETGQDDSASVEVCAEEVPPVDPPVDPVDPPVDPVVPPEKPEIPTGAPEASGPNGGMIAAGAGMIVLAALLGGAYVLRRRGEGTGSN
ncbi:vWA domain-containing protein [Ornithinicoccus hortensis]|uniref:VWFA domain-containing protein n=1 Tax=Ornithinicoccus hortensis TaxID=82346 RepID=A0A542YNR5_9MICO|nr:vWA domain-containing protein [Ornithinicoccus hortensis]TQL49679.1 hypothetical protein FB467_0765 [Ornithinicoccus hortensis]